MANCRFESLPNPMFPLRLERNVRVIVRRGRFDIERAVRPVYRFGQFIGHEVGRHPDDTAPVDVGWAELMVDIGGW